MIILTTGISKYLKLNILMDALVGLGLGSRIRVKGGVSRSRFPEKKPAFHNSRKTKT